MPNRPRTTLLRTFSTALALALALAVAACNGGAPTEVKPAAGVQDAAAQATVSGSGKIRGAVTEDGLDVSTKLHLLQGAGKIVPGAEVYLDDLPSIRTTSRADGSFELGGVPVGDHYVVAEKKSDKGALKVRTKATIAAPEQIADLKSLVLRRTGSVTGLVTLGGASTGLLGTDVFVAGSTLISKAKDNGQFALIDVAEGVYKVTASRGGYEPTTVEVEIKAGKIATVAIDLKKADPSAKVATIGGTVKGAGDRPLAGANVSLRGPGNITTITDEAGGFLLANVPDGAYVLHVYSPGHTIHAASVTVAVDPADPKSREITLGTLALTPDAAAPAGAGGSRGGSDDRDRGADGGSNAGQGGDTGAGTSTGTGAGSAGGPAGDGAGTAGGPAPAGGATAGSGGAPAGGSGGTLGPSTEVADGGVAIPGKLDLEVAFPGGTPRTTNFGQTMVGDKPYDVSYGQVFAPSKDGAVSAIAFSISSGERPQGADTTVAVHEAGADGSPQGARLGAVVLPGASIKRFGLGSLWSPVVFGKPIPVQAGKKYVAVVSTKGDNVLLLSNKPAPGGALRISFAEIGSEGWLWNEIPDNEGYNFAVFRVYLAE